MLNTGMAWKLGFYDGLFDCADDTDLDGWDGVLLESYQKGLARGKAERLN